MSVKLTSDGNKSSRGIVVDVSYQSWKAPRRPLLYIAVNVSSMVEGTTFITQTGYEFNAAENPPNKAFMSITFRISALLTFISAQYC